MAGAGEDGCLFCFFLVFIGILRLQPTAIGPPPPPAPRLGIPPPLNPPPTLLALGGREYAASDTSTSSSCVTTELAPLWNEEFSTDTAFSGGCRWVV